jgi:DNA-directed RNA polymerase subunit RPC12/RpoP
MSDYRLMVGTPLLRSTPSGFTCLTCGADITRSQRIGGYGRCRGCHFKATLKAGAAK